MKNYEKHLTSMGYRVTYIDALDRNADIRTFLETQVMKNVHYIATILKIIGYKRE